MINARQRRDDIADGLRIAAEVKGVPLLESEIVAVANRLVPYHGAALARLIASLPGRNFFPSGAQIEQEIRELLGKTKHGLTAADIEKNERELVVSGMDPAKAKVGAEVLRKTLRIDPAPSPLAELEDFGDEPKNPLDALADF